MKISIGNFLSIYSGKKVYFVTNLVNTSDTFIAYSTYCLFNQLNICYEIISSNNDIYVSNEIIFFGDGENLVEGKYGYLYNGIETERLYISILAAIFENSIAVKYQNISSVNTYADLLHSCYVMNLLKMFLSVLINK